MTAAAVAAAGDAGATAAATAPRAARALCVRHIHEQNVAVATLYLLGSSGHERDMAVLHDHVREGHETQAGACKIRIAESLEAAADAVIEFAKGDVDDAVLEVDSAAAAIEALELRQAAVALRRQTVAEIRAALLAADGVVGRGRRRGAAAAPAAATG